MEVKIERSLEATPESVAEYLANAPLNALVKLKSLMFEKGIDFDCTPCDLVLSQVATTEPGSY